MKCLIIASENQIKLVDKPIPNPEANEVLIKISAAALNKRDQFISKGLYPNIQFGKTLGSDGVGEVVDIGESAHKRWLNQKVIINPNIHWGNDDKVQSPQYTILGMPIDGTFAEYVVVDQDRIHPIPKHLSDVEAAALPLAGLTAYRACFFHGHIKDNDKVLISGFGGGVAQYAFQYALAVGAKVYVTSGSVTKRKYAVDMGAIEAFDYHDKSWLKTSVDTMGGFDAIIDSAGGKQLNGLIKTMRPGGRIVFYGATNGLPESIDLYKMFWNQITLQGSTMGNDQEFKDMLAFVEQHQIKPLIDSTRPFGDILSAFEDIGAPEKLGKLVIKL